VCCWLIAVAICGRCRASFHLPAVVSRGPSHTRIIAIGSAGQNISGGAIRVGGSNRVGGATTTGNSTFFAVVAAVFEALFLRACRRLAVDVPAFFAVSFGRRFLAFRICSCHLGRPCEPNSLGDGRFHRPIPPLMMSASDPKRKSTDRRNAKAWSTRAPPPHVP